MYRHDEQRTLNAALARQTTSTVDTDRPCTVMSVPNKRWSCVGLSMSEHVEKVLHGVWS